MQLNIAPAALPAALPAGWARGTRLPARLQWAVGCKTAWGAPCSWQGVMVPLGSCCLGHGSRCPWDHHAPAGMMGAQPQNQGALGITGTWAWDHSAAGVTEPWAWDYSVPGIEVPLGSRWQTRWCPACSTPSTACFWTPLPAGMGAWWGDTRQCLGLTYGDQASLPASLNCTLISLAVACAGDGAAHALGHTWRAVLGLPRSRGECLSPSTMLATA